MKSGFGHFDASHRENFCAALLLLAMEVDDEVKRALTDMVRTELKLESTSALRGFGREARLGTSSDGGSARVDLWFLFDSPAGEFFAFVEVKTHNGWDPAEVARQVQDQTERSVARSARRVHGCLLLAPERLCRRVRSVDPNIRAVSWPALLDQLRPFSSSSRTTEHVIRHLEQQMENPPNLERPLSLDQFEQATTIVACLRQFLVECADDLGGSVRGEPLYLTPGDGKPRRSADWAWHGLSVPFTLEGQKGRVGIYKYSEAPPDQTSALETLWLEIYLGDDSDPAAFVEFALPSLASEHLEATRAALLSAWKNRSNEVAEHAPLAQPLRQERLPSIRDSRLTNLTRIGGGEGFESHTAEFEGEPAVVVDSSTLADFLDKDESADLVSVMVFADPLARQRFVAENHRGLGCHNLRITQR